MKKKIIIIAFALLIAFTAVFFTVLAVSSYLYDMDPKNGVDLFEGFAAAFTLLIGGFVILYELDLFYTTYYFFVKPKTPVKTILNILSNLSLVLMFVYGYLSHVYMELRAYEETSGILFLAYFFLRMIYVAVSIV